MNIRAFLVGGSFAIASLALHGCTDATSPPMPTSSPDASANNAVANNAVANNAVANNAVATPKPATPSPSPTASPKASPAASSSASALDERYKAAPIPANYPPELRAALKKAAVPRPLKATKVPDKATVRLETSQGNIEVQLDGKAAPLHVKNFLYLSGRGFYNGTVFHRYEPGFVIQGGDPLTKNADSAQFAGSGGPGYEVPREYNSLKHDAMVLAAARSADPDSAGSQFYFTLQAASFLDKEQSQDGVGYTVYGKVLKGKDVVLKLRADDVLKKVVILEPKN